MKKIILMLLAVTALTACSKFEPVSKGGDENVPVELYGNIYTGAATRGEGVIGGIPADGLVFDLYRANQNPNYSAFTVKVEGTLATDETITTNPKLYYLGEGVNSTFIGLHPVGGTLANNTVTYDLDGSDDILATESVEGNNTTPPNKALTFKHLLTKIQVDIKLKDGEDPGIINSIGGIESIQVVDKAYEAVVTLPTPVQNPPVDARPIIAAGDKLGDGLLSLWAADGKAFDGTLNADGSATTIGYAMFLPSTADELLTLKIITKEDEERVHTVVVPKTAKSFEQGKGYIITIALTANSLGLIEFELDNVTAGIEGWIPVAPTPDDEVVY
jgi:hypothetical protein